MDGSEIITLNVEGQLISCGKGILVNGSDYFRAMFDSDMIETRTNEVTLKDEQYIVIKALIDCLTSGNLEISDNIQELTAASVRFQMQSVTDVCVNYLKKTLDNETCLGQMIFAASLNLSHLRKVAKRHALYYFNRVIQCEEFVTLDLEEVVDYLSDRRLHCESELDILRAIEIWIRHESEHRMAHLSDLLMCFHGEDLDADERIHVKCQSILKDTVSGEIWLQQFKEQPDEGLDQSVFKKYREMPVAILSVGNRIGQDGHLQIDILKLCKSENTLKAYQQFNSSHIGYKVHVIGKDFYLTGGQTSLTRSVFMKDVWKFDGFDQTWTIVTQLPEPRRHHGACTSNTSLFLLGGFGKYRDVLDTVQEYNVEKDQWKNHTPMKSKGYSLQVEYCDNKLYLCREENIECLDLQAQSWTQICMSRFIGNDAGYTSIMPVAYKNYVYLFKFNNHYYELPDDQYVEDWNHTKEWVRLDTKTLQFSTHACHENLNFGHRLTAFDGKLYMLNYDTNDIVMTSLHDLRSFAKLGTSMSGKEEAFCSLVVLPDYPV